MRPVETEGDLGQHLPSLSQRPSHSLPLCPSLSLLIYLCCMSFQACVQVLLSDVLSAGFHETQLLSHKKVGHPIIPLVSPHICLGGYGWGLFFIAVVVYLLFEKEIALFKE